MTVILSMSFVMQLHSVWTRDKSLFHCHCSTSRFEEPLHCVGGGCDSSEEWCRSGSHSQRMLREWPVTTRLSILGMSCKNPVTFMVKLCALNFTHIHRHANLTAALAAHCNWQSLVLSCQATKWHKKQLIQVLRAAVLLDSSFPFSSSRKAALFVMTPSNNYRGIEQLLSQTEAKS